MLIYVYVQKSMFTMTCIPVLKVINIDEVECNLMFLIINEIWLSLKYDWITNYSWLGYGVNEWYIYQLYNTKDRNR